MLLSVPIFLPHPFRFCKGLASISDPALKRATLGRPGESILERHAELCYKTIESKLPAPDTMRDYDITPQSMP